jgi:hypothetical protein
VFSGLKTLKNPKTGSKNEEQGSKNEIEGQKQNGQGFGPKTPSKMDLGRKIYGTA